MIIDWQGIITAAAIVVVSLIGIRSKEGRSRRCR